MSVSYLGITVSSWTYVCLLLFALVVFTIIMLATEKERQRRHHREMMRHRVAMKNN